PLIFGMIKKKREWDIQTLAAGKKIVFDRSFIEMNTVGFYAMMEEIDSTALSDIHTHTGLSPEHLQSLAKMYLDAKTAIFCWCMGIT
ncbi:CbbBc protein, partial [Acinetobacter johnsonii]